MTSLRLKILLFFAGLIGVGIGGAILFAPIAFHATSGIIITDDASLLSEMRAAGGVLFACGFLVLLGSFMRSLTFTSLVLATVLYLSYGVSRLVSMAIDGMPSDSLVLVTGFELAVGVICALALAKAKNVGSPDGTA